MSIFLNKIVKGVNKIYGEDPLRKALAVHIINYIIYLDKQEFLINVSGLGVFARLNVDYLRSLKDEGDDSQQTSLFETTMNMLIKTNLIFEKDLASGNDWDKAIHISGYSIFKSVELIANPELKLTGEPFEDLNYRCKLSDEFWNDYRFQMNLN